MRQSSVTSNTLRASVNFFGSNHCPKICRFCVDSGAPDLIYPGTSLYEHILWMHLEKNPTYESTFPVQRKEINVVKVCFTMRYSSRKLSNNKVITTACNFWRQIACSFQVMSGNMKSHHFFKPSREIWAKKFSHAHHVFPPWKVVLAHEPTRLLYIMLAFFRAL